MAETLLTPELIAQVAAIAAARGSAVADIPAEELARALGISRMTLYRRIGSRAALHDALRAAGHDPGERPGVRERAIAAAAAIVREGGLPTLTLESVAERADCSLAAVYSQLGGRQGLMVALFERYSPLPAVEEALRTAPDTLDGGVRAIYAALYDTIAHEPALLRGMFSSLLLDPDGEVGLFCQEWYLPRIFATAGAWMQTQIERGRVRPVPFVILMQTLVAPLGFHVATRAIAVGHLGLSLPSREEAIALLADAWCRAFGTTHPEEEAPS